MDGDSSKAIFFDREASLRNISGQETNEMECWILPRGRCEEREGGRQRPTLFVVVVSIDADYDDVGYPECMSIGYACNLDVALFHSWLQGVTSKSVKTSENSLLNPGGCFPRNCRQGNIRPRKRGKELQRG